VQVASYLQDDAASALSTLAGTLVPQINQKKPPPPPPEATEHCTTNDTPTLAAPRTQSHRHSVHSTQQFHFGNNSIRSLKIPSGKTCIILLRDILCYLLSLQHAVQRTRIAATELVALL
jgi:hypothetical protein